MVEYPAIVALPGVIARPGREPARHSNAGSESADHRGSPQSRMRALGPARSLPGQGRGAVDELGHGQQDVRGDFQLVTGLVKKQIAGVRGARNTKDYRAVFLFGCGPDLADLLPDRFSCNFLFVWRKAWLRTAGRVDHVAGEDDRMDPRDP